MPDLLKAPSKHKAMSKQNVLLHEECPSCGAKISVGRKAIARKIRCPQCRRVVVVEAGPPASSGAAVVPPEPGVSGPISPPEHSHEFWVDPIDHGAAFLGERQKGELLRYLSGRKGLQITIQASPNEPDALLFSHTLLKIFSAAGWRASAGQDAAPRSAPRKAHGALALFTGSWPFPEEVTRACMALTAAGLEFSSHIDPEQASEKAILVIAGDIRRTVREGRAGSPKAAEAQPEPATAEDHGAHPIFEEFNDADWEREVERWKTSPAPGNGWLHRICETAAAKALSGTKRPELGGVLSRGIRLAEVIAAEISGGPPAQMEKDWLPLLRELNSVLREMRLAAAGDAKAGIPLPLGRRCAKLAVALLEKGPGDRDRGREEAKPQQMETPWVSALRFADAVFAEPPVSDDVEPQKEFEELLARTLRAGEPATQRIIAAEVRSWHWFRTAGRRTLHDQLFYHEARCEKVMNSAFSRLQYWPPAERESIFRRVLQRDDLESRSDLAETLGHVLGWEGILMDEENNCSPTAHLVREVIETPAAFPFLRPPEIRREFLRHFVIGMTEGAKRVCEFPQRAGEFAEWCHRAWVELETLEGDGSRDPRGVVLFACYWLGKQHRRKNVGVEILRPWWRAVSRMLLEVVRTGGMRDISTVFFTLRDGSFLDLPTAHELLELVGAYLDRLHDGAEDFSDAFHQEMEQRDESGQPISRHVAGCIADLLVGLRHDGRVIDHADLQLARSFLLRLATDQTGSCKAADSLFHFEFADDRGPLRTETVRAA